MTDLLPRDNVRSRAVADAFARFWGRILLVTVLLGAAVGGYAYLGPHTYKSTASVLVRPLTGNALSTQTTSSSQSTTVAMETEAGLVTSIAVTQVVNRALGTDLKAGTSDVTSTVPVNSQIVQITYTGTTARAAQRRAQAYAQAFLAYRSDLAVASQKAQVDQLTAQTTSVEQQLEQASQQANLTKNKPADADTKVRLYTSRLSSLQAQIGEVQSISTDPGSIVTPAALPLAASGLNPALLTGVAAIVGLIIATTVALWRVRVDDRIRAGAEPTIVGLPVLAVVPGTDTGSTRGSAKANITAGRTEALRRARTGLLAVAPPGSVVAVAGLSDRDSTVALAADLARSLASANYRVALVDATIDGIGDGTATADQTGLSELLADPALPDTLPLGTLDGFRFLGPGTDPASARERYSGQLMRELLERLQIESDYVLVATAPAGSSDGMGVLLATDNVVLTATDARSTHEEVAAAASAVDRLGVRVVGLVVRRGADRHEPLRADSLHDGRVSAKHNPIGSVGRDAGSEARSDAGSEARSDTSSDAEDDAPSGEAAAVQSRAHPRQSEQRGRAARTRTRISRTGARNVGSNQRAGSHPEHDD